MSRKNYFEAETAVSLRNLQECHDDFMYFRIPDTNMQRFVSEKIIAIKTPADFLGVHSGRTYFLECKSTKRKTPSYPLRYIRDHQLEYLHTLEECGGVGWFLLNNRSSRMNIYAVAVRPSQISEWMGRTRKSVRWREIKEKGIELERIIDGGRSRWDLKPLFGIID